MTADFDVILNFNSATPVKTGAEFKAGDKGFTINMTVKELDPTGMTPKIAFYRANGTSVESSSVTNVGNVYSYTLLGNELAVPGVVVADLKFYDGDEQRVSSASFIFTVIADTLDGLGGGTGGYSDQLEELSQEFAETLQEYQDAFGDVGATNPRGEYDALEEYTALDLVSYNGNSYLCREGCTGIAPTNTTYWQVFASGGGSGTDDYEDLENKPSINGVELSGDKSTGDLNISIPQKTKDLDDVDSTTPNDGQILKYDAASNKYIPVDESADNIKYNNSDSGLSATDVKAALDELAMLKNYTRRARKDISANLLNLGAAVNEQNLEKYGYTIGDYFKRTDGAREYIYTLADLNTFKGTKTPYCISDNHITIVVDTGTDAKWDASTASNGYVNSGLHTLLSGTVLTNIQSDMIALFGGSTGLEHLLSQSKMMTTGVSSFAWQTDQYISALTESNLIGHLVFSANGYQEGEAAKPLAVFQKYKATEILENRHIWLRNIASSSEACLMFHSGDMNLRSVTNNYGVFGLIVFH